MGEKLTLSGKTLSLGGTLRPNPTGRSGVQVEVRKQRRVITNEQKPAQLSENTAQKLRLLQEAQKVAEHAKQLEMERKAKEEKARQEALNDLKKVRKM